LARAAPRSRHPQSPRQDPPTLARDPHRRDRTSAVRSGTRARRPFLFPRMPQPKPHDASEKNSPSCQELIPGT
jgi:hypothetical protein